VTPDARPSDRADNPTDKSTDESGDTSIDEIVGHRVDPLDPQLVRAAAAGSELGQLVLDAWQRTRIDWGFVTDRLSDAFRARRRLGGRERRFVAETLFGMVRHARRVDEALAAGGLRAAPDRSFGQASGQILDRARLLAFFTLEAGLTPDEAARCQLRTRRPIDWAQVAAIDDHIARESNAARRIARAHSLPDWLARALVADHGDEAEPLAAALNRRAPMTIRVNTLAAERDAVAAELAAAGLDTAPGRYAPTALHVLSRTNLFALDGFRRGAFEAQDEGSQLVAELVAPPPKARVVDYCAGAGGKTLAMAAIMGNKGRVIAADVDSRKLSELRRRARRAGVSTVQTAVIEPDGAFDRALAAIDGKAHRVLVDAPCTGVGALRRNPEAKWRLREADLARLPALQFDILSAALSLVAPGGRLVYATCTVLRAENDDVIDRLCAAHPGLERMPIKAIWGVERAAPLSDADGACLRLTPHRHGTDGFFAAVLRRPRG
jgi:16S rRNA (cytosine967-C5)-methyltransferase